MDFILVTILKITQNFSPCHSTSPPAPVSHSCTAQPLLSRGVRQMRSCVPACATASCAGPDLAWSLAAAWPLAKGPAHICPWPLGPKLHLCTAELEGGLWEEVNNSSAVSAAQREEIKVFFSQISLGQLARGTLQGCSWWLMALNTVAILLLSSVPASCETEKILQIIVSVCSLLDCVSCWRMFYVLHVLNYPYRDTFTVRSRWVNGFLRQTKENETVVASLLLYPVMLAGSWQGNLFPDMDCPRALCTDATRRLCQCRSHSRTLISHHRATEHFAKCPEDRACVPVSALPSINSSRRISRFCLFPKLCP